MIHVVLLGQVGLVALAGLVGDVALMCVMALVGFGGHRRSSICVFKNLISLDFCLGCSSIQK